MVEVQLSAEGGGQVIEEMDLLKSTSVLYVEDDPDVREQLAQFLRRRVGRLFIAQNGREGLEQWREHHPEVVITDIMMPVMDGLKMAQQIRAESATIPIIVTTAFNETDFLLKAIDLGIDKYVIKPVRTHLLQAALQQAARMAKAELTARLAGTVFNISSDGIMIADGDRRIIEVNPAFCAMTGYSAKELLGERPTILKSGRQDEAFYQRMWQSLARRGMWSGEIWNRRKDGEIYAAWLTINTVRGRGGDVTHYVAILADITEHKRAEEKIRHLAHYDVLTELPNRVLFNDRLVQALLKLRRSRHSGAVMFLDLDRFKYINDTFGHSVGDALLRETALRLRACVRQGDTVSRLGGDEFVVLLPEIGAADDAAVVAQKVLNAIAPPFVLDGHELSVTVSIGITLFPADGVTAEELMRNADAAMYRAKDLGRNNYQFYHADMNARSFERLAMENSIRRALERSQFELHYQPRYRLPEGQVVGAEALIRWHHPELGLLMPGQFIRLAEESGLIVPLGEWVVRAAVAQAAEWARAGLAPMSMAVNVSARQLRQNDFVEMVERILAEHGLDPKHLEIELTESVLMADENVAVLRQLAALGSRIAIDDFGTGYSSLGYLKRLPVDIVKLDRSFVAEVTSTREDGAIVEAIVAMAHKLSLHTIAEGVETLEQAHFLQALGCREMQGFYFSAAVPAPAFVRLLGPAAAKSIEEAG